MNIKFRLYNAVSNRNWFYFTDPFVHLWYRVTYCSRHGHLYKMDMPDWCVNCAKPRPRGG
jgi:hypothetical protein